MVRTLLVAGTQSSWEEEEGRFPKVRAGPPKAGRYRLQRREEIVDGQSVVGRRGTLNPAIVQRMLPCDGEFTLGTKKGTGKDDLMGTASRLSAQLGCFFSFSIPYARSRCATRGSLPSCIEGRSPVRPLSRKPLYRLTFFHDYFFITILKPHFTG